MKQDLITVIIPVYNHENYVKKTIESIIQQSYENIELIVINDGSSDNSNESVKEIAQECEQRFAKYTHIDKKNEGIIKTLNIGIKQAEGKYLYVIASDDIAEENALTVLHEFLSVNPEYGLAVGGNTLMDDKGARCYWDKNSDIVYSEESADYISFDDFLRKSRPSLDFLSDDFGTYENILIGNHVPNGYLLDKKTVDDFEGYSVDSPLEDLYLMLQMAKRKKLKFIDTPLFRYRWHASNSIKNTVKIGQVQHKTILQERNYCFSNGHTLTWLKRAYLPGFKYRLNKIKSILTNKKAT
jgi:alpha-1,3-rhamnosyltransferase